MKKLITLVCICLFGFANQSFARCGVPGVVTNFAIDDGGQRSILYVMQPGPCLLFGSSAQMAGYAAMLTAAMNHGRLVTVSPDRTPGSTYIFIEVQ